MGGFIGKVQELILSPKPTPELVKYVGGGLLFIVLVIILVTVFNNQVQQAKTPPIASPENVALIQAKRQESINSDKQLDGSNSWNGLINQLAPGERYLVNFCPLTASLGGYIGGDEVSGVFYSDFYLQKALRAGIRSFVLPICTYMDDNKLPPNWPMSGDPAIVARDTTGKIISLNGLSVKQFCTDLIRFNGQNPSQSSEPLMLHIIEDKYLPDHVKDEKRYAKVLSKLASDLSVIPPSMRLTNLGGYGSAVSSQNESNILTQAPLSELQGKVIIFTNFKTTVGQKSAYASMKPTLDDFTNFTIRPVIAQNAGLAVGSGSRSLRLADISGSSIAWTDQARTVYHMTQDYNLTNPTVGSVDNAIRTGIQVVPVPFYCDSTSLKPTWDLWKGYSWRIKEKEARYLKPDPVVPATPSARMNARVSPDLQPGQAVVG
jgi:hypothetical protein